MDHPKAGVASVFRRAEPRPTVAERHALETLRSRLFGRRSGPIALSRYVLLRRLGAGGSGVVFEAHDPELGRRVAVKLVAPRRGDPTNADQASARLLREAQSLARLAHPNVVPVYDVGRYEETDLTLPAQEIQGSSPRVPPPRGLFIVMELVEGQTLREWLRQGDRPWKEVLAKFLDAAEGLAAAHENGLVHRDFKPSNVIIGTDGRVRVLDFGLARAVHGENLVATPTPSEQADDEPPPSTDLTRTGTIMGTPVYMAPEQHRGDPVDVRTDQYSFCVALFEGLYGVRPFEGDDRASLAQAKDQRRFVPTSDPGIPSRIRRAVERGLEPSPDDRFPTLRALVAELGRDLPAQRRHSMMRLVAIVSTAAAIGAGGLAWSQQRRGPCMGQDRLLTGVWDADVRRRAEDRILASGLPYATKTWATVADTLDRYSQTWTSTREATCEETLVKGARPRAHMDAVMLCLDGQLRGIAALTSLLERADPDIVQHATEMTSRLADPSDCVGRSFDGQEDLDPGSIIAVQEQLARAEALRIAAQLDEARSSAEQALTSARSLGDAPTLAQALLTAGRIERTAMRFERSETLLFEAFEHAESADDQVLAQSALVELIPVVGIQGRTTEADHLARQAKIKRRKHGFGNDLNAAYAAALGRLRMDQGLYDGAIEAFDDGLATWQERGDNPDDRSPAPPLALADLYNSKGIAQMRRGGGDRGRESFRRSLEIYERVMGPDHPLVARSLNNLANALEDPAEALPLRRRVLALRRTALRPTHPHVASAVMNEGVTLQALGRADEALTHYREAIRLYEAETGTRSSVLVRARTNVAEALLQSGQPSAALAEARTAVELAETVHPAGHIRLRSPLTALGWSLLESGDPRSARSAFDRALQTGEGPLRTEHDSLVRPLHGLGTAQLRTGDLPAAVATLERALAIARSTGANPRELGEIEKTLQRANRGSIQ